MKKKADLAQTAGADSAKEFAPWGDLNFTVCEYVAKCLTQEVEPGSTAIATGDAKSLFEQLPEKLLSYSFGNEATPSMVITAVDPVLVNRITDARLGQNSKTKADPSPLGLLDLILMQSFAKISLEGINQYIEKLDPAQSKNGLTQTHQSLSLLDYEIDKRVGNWVQLTFSLNVVGQEPLQAQPDDENGSETSNTTNAFYLFLPKKLMDAIFQRHSMDASAAGGEVTCPWADHMVDAVRYAEVSLQAVLETCQMSVADCTRLEIGQIIPLPSAPLHSIKLETQTEDGLVELGISTLGTYKSNKAVQLSDNVLTDFISGLDTIVI